MMSGREKKRLKSETLSAGQIIQLTDCNVVASSLYLLRQHGHTIKCNQKSFTRPLEFFLLIKLYTSVNERIKKTFNRGFWFPPLVASRPPTHEFHAWQQRRFTEPNQRLTLAACDSCVTL